MAGWAALIYEFVTVVPTVDSMKIILIVTGSKRKSLAFVSNGLDTFSLEKAVQLTREGEIEGAHVVQRGNNVYLRTNPKVGKSDEFDSLSITVGNLLLYAHGTHLTKVTPALDLFVELYRTNLSKNHQLIKPVGQQEVLSESVKKKLQKYRGIIFEAANNFDIDVYLLGAILVDEIARLVPFEPIFDTLRTQIIGGNTSVGIAQVRTDTANNIIKLGLYNPNPNDTKLPFKKLDRDARGYLYTYLIDPKHSIFFAAAVIKDIIESWYPVAENKLTPPVIATLYSKGGKPHSNPTSNERGQQIAGEFYNFAKEILTLP